MDIVSEFIRSETVRTIVRVYDDNDALVDPTAVYITITDPDGGIVVDNQNITAGKTTTGIYEHYYQTAESVRGWYQGLAKVVDGSGLGAKYSIGTFSFNVR